MNGKEACSPNLQLIIHEFVSGETCLKVKICCKNMIIHISIESIDVVFFCFVAAFAFGAFFCPSPSFGGSTVFESYSRTSGESNHRQFVSDVKNAAIPTEPRGRLLHLHLERGRRFRHRKSCRFFLQYLVT